MRCESFGPFNFIGHKMKVILATNTLKPKKAIRTKTVTKLVILSTKGRLPRATDTKFAIKTTKAKQPKTILGVAKSRKAIGKFVAWKS